MFKLFTIEVGDDLVRLLLLLLLLLARLTLMALDSVSDEKTLLV